MIAQVALAVVLLSAAGLMLNSVVKLSRVRPGFDADHLLTFRIALTGSNYARRARPGRVRVGAARAPRSHAGRAARGAQSSMIPFGGHATATPSSIEGRPAGPGDC